MRKYLFALLIGASSVLLEVAFRDAVGGAVFLLPYPAVFLVAWYLGFGPSLISTVVSALGVALLLTPTGEPGSGFRLGLFVVLSLIISRALSRSQQTSAESVERFKAVFEQAAVGIGRVRFSDAKWADVNTAFCRMLGYSAEELKAKPWPEITYPDDLDLDLAPFRRMAAGEIDMYTIEKRFIHHQGHPVWARLTLSSVRDDDGKPEYEIAIIEDITAQKVSEKKLLNAVQSRDEMMAVVSHDLKNPLSAIGLAADLLVRKCQSGCPPGFVADRAITIKQSSTRVVRLISDLLDISRIESGRLELIPCHCTVASVVSDALQDLRIVAESRKVKIIEKLTCPDEELVCDPGRIAQVFSNLVGNAVKYVPEKTGVIEIRSDCLKDQISFSVIDNGPGIPAEDLPFIFDRFWQSRKANKAGAGLGLAIARGIIHAHAGKIWAESKPGEGARFYFLIPRANSAVGRDLLEQRKREPAA